MSAMEPNQQQPQRPRSKSTFSFKSDKSHGSHGTKHDKHDHHHQRHSSKDEHKPHTELTTKADPNAAMNEVQPVAAALEKPTLQSLRAVRHTDLNGNPIAEPDLSNPTRSRWERPLDTIRSFEAAIDTEYRRRSTAVRHDAPSDAMSGYASRRSSYVGGGYEHSRGYQGGGGYYGSRQAAGMRESWADNGYGPGPGARSRYNRMQSDPGFNRQNNGHNVYPTPAYQQSRDTVNTGGSNGSHSEQYSTDPSSENSSIERGGPVRHPDLGEQYGFSGFGGGPQPILEEFGSGNNAQNNGYFQQQHAQGGPPPVPRKSQPPPNNPNVIKLSNSRGQGPPPVNGERPNVLSRKTTNESDKRKSWFKRRFSKN